MFQICTISNNPLQYAEMKASLLAAGFDELRCRYQVFDNSEDNAHDPFQTINRVMDQAAKPYVIFCHQDILLDHGDGYDQLAARLEALNRIDPDWAIAGNAGCTVDLRSVYKIDDPHGRHDYGSFPEKVSSLDENFFVIKTASHLRCSETLRGFHLYATDLCLQAAQRGQSSYVIDFHVTHLSGGSPGGTDFEIRSEQFKAHWNPYFWFCIVQTPCTFFHLSRSPFLRRVLRSGLLMTWLKSHMAGYRWLAQTNDRFRRLTRRSKQAAPASQYQPADA